MNKLRSDPATTIMWISWNHKDTDFKRPFTFEQKVELFYQQALGWQLHTADLVANGGTCFGENGSPDGKVVSSIRHSGFAVLQICLSYFETVGRYTGERGSSKAAFRKGVLEVFRELLLWQPERVDVAVAALYSSVRCGLYHNTRTAKLALGKPPYDAAITYLARIQTLMVSPERLPRKLKAHLEQFRADLLDQKNSSLRTDFENQFDIDDGHPKPLIKGHPHKTNNA